MPSLAQRAARKFSADDSGNADRIVYRYRDDIRYDPERDVFYTWSDTKNRWVEASQAALRVMAEKTLLDLSQEAALHDNPGDFMKWAASQRALRTYDTAAKMLTARPDIWARTEDFEADGFVLNTPSGVLDLRTDKLHAEDAARTHLCLNQTGVPYDPGASRKNWERFLELVQPKEEHRAYLARLAGLTLVGEALEQVYVLHLGDGGNGKGVFHTVLSRVLGSYARKTETRVFQVRQRSFSMAEWEHKRMVFADEISGAINLDLLKEVTGGDKLDVEKKGKQSREIHPRFMIHLRANYAPDLTNDDANARRLLLVKWRVKPTARQWNTFREGTETVPDYLVRTCGSGVLNWALDGWRDYRDHEGEDRLRVPEDFGEEAKRTLAEGDSIALFLSGRTKRAKGRQIKQSEMWMKYKLYCCDLGFKYGTAQQFNRVLRDKHKIEHNGSHGHPAWLDIALDFSQD